MMDNPKSSKISEDFKPHLGESSMVNNHISSVHNEVKEIKGSSSSEWDGRATALGNRLCKPPFSKLNKENSDLAEPNYRFYNRKRQGSIISISMKDHQIIAQGKAITFFDPKSGELLKVKRVVLKEKPFGVCENQAKQEPCPPLPSSSIQTGQQESSGPEASIGAELLVQSNSIEMEELGPRKQSSFGCATRHARLLDEYYSFQVGQAGDFDVAKPSRKPRRNLLEADFMDKSHHHPSGKKKSLKRSSTKRKDAPTFLLNSNFFCRFQVGRKRKLAPPITWVYSPKEEIRLYEVLLSFLYDVPVSLFRERLCRCCRES